MPTRETAHLNKPGKEIFWFDDLGTGNEKFNFLSNFYEGKPLVLPLMPHQEFKTGEHAFQALKATNAADMHLVASASGPNPAKAAGRSIQLRPDWEKIKYDVMAAVIRTKFYPGREEAELLLATQDAYLCEGTFWQDECWGVDLRQGKSVGRNWLGTLLLARRAELRACRDFGVSIPDGKENMERVRDSGKQHSL